MNKISWISCTNLYTQHHSSYNSLVHGNICTSRQMLFTKSRIIIHLMYWLTSFLLLITEPWYLKYNNLWLWSYVSKSAVVRSFFVFCSSSSYLLESKRRRNLLLNPWRLIWALPHISILVQHRPHQRGVDGISKGNFVLCLWGFSAQSTLEPNWREQRKKYLHQLVLNIF